LFILYVESMISTVGNMLKSFTKFRWAHKISLSVSVLGRTLWLKQVIPPNTSLDVASLSLDPDQPSSFCIVHYICVWHLKPIFFASSLVSTRYSSVPPYYLSCLGLVPCPPDEGALHYNDPENFKSCHDCVPRSQHSNSNNWYSADNS
jgi:hypothetical protein